MGYYETFNDSFIEQLVKVKLGGVRITAILLTYFFGTAASAVLFWASIMIGFPAVGVLAVFGVMFVSWRSAGQFRVEYEYAVTNGEVDIDKIINERKRQRVLSFKCSDLENLTKYTKGENVPDSIKTRIFACTPDENSYSLTVRTKNGSAAYVVMSPDERVLEAIKAGMPRGLKLEIFGTV